jgi:hypothetical protein
MCHMVAIGVHHSARGAVRERLGYGLHPAPGYVAKEFEDGYEAFLVDVGHCACDLFQAPASTDELDRLRRKYESKGWGHSRIERVLDQRRKLGGLERGLLQRIAETAGASSGLTLLVFWDDGATSPVGPTICATPKELLAQPYMLQVGTKVKLIEEPRSTEIQHA